jgi:Domain of unknown function (DUF4375)
MKLDTGRARGTVTPWVGDDVLETCKGTPPAPHAMVVPEVRAHKAGDVTDMRVPYVTASGEDLVWKAIERVYSELQADDPRVHELTRGQQAGIALWWICAEVGNGGLHQFFSNYTGYLLPEAIDAAELVGDDELATDLRRASVGLGVPYPRDYDERNRALDALPEPGDQYWEDLDDAVWPRLARVVTADFADFVTANPDDFFLPA